MRFIQGLEWFNFEIVFKTPNVMFFYVSMVFSVGMAPKHAKKGIITLLYTFYVMQSIYIKKQRLQCLWLKNYKIRLIAPFLRSI